MSDSSSDETYENPTSSGAESSTEYTKLELHDHILHRPENYIGSTEAHQDELYVVDNDQLVKRVVNYVPGLYKIFDEILVNAADNAQRDPPTRKIQVEINKEEGYLSVWNDGRGIPIKKTYVKKEDKSYWIPEFIFGQLLTSSNFNDDIKRTTGGRNGFGAKLANIYSKLFIVECIGEGENGSFYKYTQKFTDHMENIEDPVVTLIKKKSVKTSTMIKFYPDFRLFGMEGLDDDIIAIFKRRVWDLAGVLKNVQLVLNDEKIPIKGFEDYCKKYLNENNPIVTAEVGERWKIGVALSDGTFSQVSFVNSVATTRGGTHVDYIANQISRYICKELENSRGNKVTVRPNVAKTQLFVFVNCLIENPSFDSQTKETLTLQQSKFGSKCDIPETFLKKVMKQTDIPNAIREFAKYKENSSMKKMGGRKTARIHGLAKLIDANDAGKTKSSQCTLILTEGDSAKGMVVAGLSVLGRDRYGVFPLRGKLLNTRDITTQKLAKNEEIQNIMKIMALKPGDKYSDKESLNSLRYGSIMIMTDQDMDGSHIKGLIINFIHSMWPELIKRQGFLCEFITPIVKVFKKKEKPISFYTLPEFIEWKKEHDDAKGYNVKYYKGLATSSEQEAKEYFSDFKRHRIEFQFSGENDEERIQLAFSKKRADDRKNWLAELDPDTTYLGQDTPTITYTDFIDKELILFSNYANVRAIPSVVDGLKPGQRKIMWVAFKNNIKKELKVNQLGGKVSEQSAYHHGEDSLNQTIIGLAQTFVGSNNINLFYPSGQFGTRLKGGEDAGSPRYIYTRLSKITRSIFHKDDDQLLEYLTDEGIPIEPKYYVPIIPMVLVNGSNGIGVGWSSNVPCYNPLDIIKNIRHKIRQEEMEPMVPWYSGFTGEIRVAQEQDGKPVRWSCSGRAKIITDEMIEISELPLQVWTDDYKQFLENMFIGESESSKGKSKKKEKGKETAKGKKKDDKDEQGSKFEPKISDLKEYHTTETVLFEVYVNDKQMSDIKSVGLDKFFRLTKAINATNMTLFSPEGRIKQYKSAEDIIEDFFSVRLKLYEERKTAILEDLGSMCTKISNQARFIKEFIDGQIELRNIPRKDILMNLKIRKYDLIDASSTKMPKKVADDAIAVQEENEEEDYEPSKDSQLETLQKGYNYLLTMKLWTLTKEKYQKLLNQKKELEDKIQNMMKVQPSDIWLEDLEVLEKQYIEFEEKREKKRRENIQDSLKSKKKSKSKATIKRSKSSSKVKAESKNAGDSRSDVDSQADENQKDNKKAAMSPSKKKAATTTRKPRQPKTSQASVKEEKKPVVKPAKKKSKTAFESSEGESEELDYVPEPITRRRTPHKVTKSEYDENSENDLSESETDSNDADFSEE